MPEIRATYLIETAYPLAEAAAIMAGEQSSGTFVKTPGETEQLKREYAAKVVSVEELGDVPSPSLGGSATPAGGPARYRRGRVELVWPLHNTGVDLQCLISTVAGGLFELKCFSGIKLIDIEVPQAFAERYGGPKFGVQGTRDLCGVQGRPIIGTIIKPSVGLSPKATATQVKDLIEAGLDFIKDDELMLDPPYSPFKNRVAEVMKVVNDYAQATGRKPMVAFHLSGSVDDMKRRHDIVLDHGGTCIMVSLNSVGYTGIHEIYRHTQLPIHGHRNGWGALSRCEALGWDFRAYSKLCRMAGVDHIHVNGLRNKFAESDESVIRSIRACHSPFLGAGPVMPVVGSGQWAGQAVDTYKAVDSVDLMYVCGGGIVGHPLGPAAGVQSITEAWEAALAGESLADYAKTHPSLKAALDFFG